MMKFIRSIITTIAFGVFGAGSLLIGFIMLPFAKKKMTDDEYIDYASKVIQGAWKFFIWFMETVKLIKINVSDIEKIKNIKNKVIVATHPSFIDIIILISIIPRTTCFVKNALTKNPILKNIVNSIFIPNDLEIDELKSMTKKYLDKGFNIIIFPMGSRHRQDDRPKIKKGAALIALNSNKDIVPIKITNSEDFLFINKPFYDGGKNIVQYDIQLKDTIELTSFKSESEIITKREITKEITDALYN